MMTDSIVHSVVLDRLLSLPANDIKALQTGDTIAALPIVQIPKGWKFCLHADIQAETSHQVKLEYWAVCEQFRMIHEREEVKILAQLTLWEESTLLQLFEDRGHLSLAFLRVAQLPKTILLGESETEQIKPGRFIGLSQIHKSLNQPLEVKAFIPILNDRVFQNRYRQLNELRSPEHLELEKLQRTILHYLNDIPEIDRFHHSIQQFLGWADPDEPIEDLPEWIDEITTSGNSSDGNLFEKRVRQAFISLGFTNTLNNIKASLDPDATGGAGGIDIYCEKPYPIVGECKASKHENVPNSVSAQLIHLGTTHLGKEQFEASIKIIFAAGKLTDHAEKAAIENQINIMRPDTLQRLVELKTAYPGAIDLLELKPCLEAEPFGTDADSKVNDFIDNIWNELKIRSFIIETVKMLQESNENNICSTVVRVHFNATTAMKIDYKLETDSIAHSFLVELSSPLTGYLGRAKGDNWKADRFYFLRDLIV
jgi:Domain of unknown function (DUF1802)/Restriction endonuclease